MRTSYLSNLWANRIGGASFGEKTTLYKFEKIKRAQQEARQQHPDKVLIDMGVGEPDQGTLPEMAGLLGWAAAESNNWGYADNGGMHFRGAVAQYMKRLFGVHLDPETEIMHSIGSKAALSLLPLCFINPGDIALMTVPGYPVLGTHVRYLDGEVYALPLRKEEGFLPDLEAIPEAILKASKLLVLNYPNNPTGATASRAFYEQVVAFAKKHKLIVVQDAAYAALTFDEAPTSILQVPGGRDVAVELHSLSKSFNMTGWRIGWICGNSEIIEAYAAVKSNMDSGQFLAIQEAAAYALGKPEFTENLCAKYRRRMKVLVEILNGVGLDVEPSAGTFFLYVKAPQSVAYQGLEIVFENAEVFSQWLIREHLISTVPWDDVDAYVRFSLTFDAPTEEDERKLFKVFAQRLEECRFNVGSVVNNSGITL
tara:strand:+ start:65365 stop:66639 length:1275 start_codon:yes stop_codon:yes gene_type:complete